LPAVLVWLPRLYLDEDFDFRLFLSHFPKIEESCITDTVKVVHHLVFSSDKMVAKVDS